MDRWVDDLLPADVSSDPFMRAITDLSFRDSGEQLHLGALDQALASIVGRLRRGRDAEQPAIILQLPRGRHDVAILLGIVIKLAQLVDGVRATTTRYSTGSSGPVVVAGMGTAVVERLRAVRFAGVNVAGLWDVGRVRGDGRVENLERRLTDIRRDEQRLLYLNTYVGWPRLSAQPSVVIIDRTSFASPDTFARAIEWCETHRTGQVVVVADIGDDDTVSALRANRDAVVWPCADELLALLTHVLGMDASRSSLSTNPLLAIEHEGITPVIADSELSQRLAAAVQILRSAGAGGRQFPPPLTIARQVLNLMLQLASPLDDFNRAAALDHRATPVRSLIGRLEFVGRSFPDSWRAFEQTQWAQLRDHLRHADRLLADNSPKYDDLLALLDDVTRAGRHAPVVVRAASHAAAAAIHEALNRDLPGVLDDDVVSVRSWSERAPWAEQKSVDVFVGVPPKRRQAVLWSREGTCAYILCHTAEVRLLEVISARRTAQDSRELHSTFTALSLSEPVPPMGSLLRQPMFLRHVPPAAWASPTLGVDAALLDADAADLLRALDDDAGQEGLPDRGDRTGGPVDSIPIGLDDGSVWLVGVGAEVEVLVGRTYRTIAVGRLQVGDTVIVPRGEGRDGVFERLVDAAHLNVDVRLFDTLIKRFRAAVLSAYSKCDGEWSQLARRVSERGGAISASAVTSWANGETIAPDNVEHIKAIGRLAQDSFVTREASRIDAMARALRGLHMQLGRCLNGAIAEFTAGGDGPNIRQIEEILGVEGVVEVLDEFAVRTVVTLYPQQTASSAQLGALVGPDWVTRTTTDDKSRLARAVRR